jgi:hypothetical protein
MVVSSLVDGSWADVNFKYDESKDDKGEMIFFIQFIINIEKMKIER